VALHRAANWPTASVACQSARVGSWHLSACRPCRPMPALRDNPEVARSDLPSLTEADLDRLSWRPIFVCLDPSNPAISCEPEQGAYLGQTHRPRTQAGCDFCASTAHWTASTALPNSASTLSPKVAIRSRWEASRMTRHCVKSLSVLTSSISFRRLYASTSAAGRARQSWRQQTTFWNYGGELAASDFVDGSP
jgi:hypothetical protein